MKFFIDTANIEEIKKANSLGLVDGVTTNPSLISKENKTLNQIIPAICEIIDGPISVEVLSEKCEDMIKEAKTYAKIHSNITIKVPITEEGLKTTKALSSEGIKTNVTLIFSPTQALLAARAGATFVSPFVGRLDDVSHVGMNIVSEILTIYENYNFKTEIIVASIRHPVHVLEAALIGAHISTIPYNVIAQLTKHPLTDNGIKKFKDDWNKIGC